MHFHLPKPLHGWREFAGEVGIIVLGVMIALGAEQILQSIHERSQVGQLRDALRAELADDRARWEDIHAGDNCSARRIEALEHWLAVAPAGASVNNAYEPFFWNMHTSAWDSAKMSPTGQLLGLDERLTYASLYDALDNWRLINGAEGKNAEAINALFATADQPENRRQLPLLLAHARIEMKNRQQNYPYLFTRFDALKIRGDRSKLTLNIDQTALCAPLENVG
jgi:hypothetical protein